MKLICRVCLGSGKSLGVGGIKIECPHCDGTGYHEKTGEPERKVEKKKAKEVNKKKAEYK